MTALQVSVIVPHALRFAAADLAAVARHVEDVGLDGVGATVPLAESTLVLATAAAAPSRIHVGFGVMALRCATRPGRPSRWRPCSSSPPGT
ncbi:MAG: hypothetical protein ACR2QA_16655 [Solirubrobacteraceae bacterium]